MATDTFGRSSHLSGGRGGVAGNAFQSGMGAAQDEARLVIMIEAPKRPAVRVVTTIAVCSERVLVESILVALGAGGRRIAISRRMMALLTRHGGVQADQRELRHVMIERDLLTPALLVVAGLTILAELAFVRILAPVTRIARRRELVLKEVSGMTTFTFNPCVRSS